MIKALHAFQFVESLCVCGDDEAVAVNLFYGKSLVTPSHLHRFVSKILYGYCDAVVFLRHIERQGDVSACNFLIRDSQRYLQSEPYIQHVFVLGIVAALKQIDIFIRVYIDRFALFIRQMKLQISLQVEEKFFAEPREVPVLILVIILFPQAGSLSTTEI